MQLIHKAHHWQDDTVILASDGDLTDPFSRWLRRDGWMPDDHAVAAAQLLSGDDVFLDLGANYGVFCIPVALASGAKCLAVEALQSNAVVLHSAIEANGLLGQIQYCLAAITQESAEVRISGESAYGTVAASGRRVLSYSLDDLMEEYSLPEVKLVKMDIEGCELPALQGASGFFDANPNVTFVFEANAAHCYRTGSRPQDLLRFFEDRGYFLYLCRSGHLVRRTSEHFQESGVSDYIASRLPLERVIQGFLFEEFDQSHLLRETLKSMTEMKSGYRLSAIQQMDLAPTFIREHAEICRIARL